MKEREPNFSIIIRDKETGEETAPNNYMLFTIMEGFPNKEETSTRLIADVGVGHAFDIYRTFIRAFYRWVEENEGEDGKARLANNLSSILLEVFIENSKKRKEGPDDHTH